jgi:hypothetical protein
VQQPPFFIVGCVRSGTTLLRDVLRKHPNLASPEETHFYRWPDPFGTEGSRKILLSNPVLKRHRALDGITEEEFQRMVRSSTSRTDLYWRYMGMFMNRRKPEAKRWFDKTPQNVYGAALLATEFPNAKIVHIVRNPLDVVASLRIGIIVKVENIIGACNYWIEAAEILSVIRRAYPKRVYELTYEALTAGLLPETEKLLAFLGEEFRADHFSDIAAAPKQHRHESLFSRDELALIAKLCGRWAAHYGYDLSPKTGEAAQAASG